MNPITGLLMALGALTAVYLGGWTRAIREARASARSESPATDGRFPTAQHLGVGAVTNFFDTLGIGSFATTTAIFRLRNMVPDRLIPGTLNVGHTIPTIAQAFIYTSVIPVDVLTLFAMITAAVLGSWLGAGVVSSWSKKRVQFGMGAALLVAATLLLITQIQAVTGSRILPLGGDALGVRGTLLVVAVAGNFLLGALMTLGIGLYAPCMILVSLLGMNPTAAFPIMMGSCAFLMPAASIRFVRTGRYDLRAALGLTIAGTPAVLIAGLIVKKLPLYAVKWLVVVVVVYTAIAMLRSATRNVDNVDEEGRNG